jgi:hypothetical protein
MNHHLNGNKPFGFQRPKGIERRYQKILRERGSWSQEGASEAVGLILY